MLLNVFSVNPLDCFRAGFYGSEDVCLFIPLFLMFTYIAISENDDTSVRKTIFVCLALLISLENRVLMYACQQIA